ncbi:MAG TPA: AAA-like domain-containing protein [Mucilaginibacter sp.]|jgi:hypothetical protein
MANDWINPKIILGNTATGDYYYGRPHIIANIWDEIKKGNHVLLAAPRRVGKSSVMKHMTESCLPGYKCIFENIQGIDSDESFYKTIYKLVKTCLSTHQKVLTLFQDFLKELKIEEISIDGSLKLGGRSINYLEAINHILPKLNSLDFKIVLFIDELPEVLHNLYKKGNNNEAKGILKNIRRWRQEDQFKNFRLVLAGSIGIQYVVKSIEGRIVDTNDFNNVDFEALTKQEADKYISWATDNNATIQYDEELQTYLLSKIQYYLPYFINLMLDEINKKARKDNVAGISKKDIDAAFEKIVKNNDHFKDWKNRLFDYMPMPDALFLNEVLIYIAHNEKISKQKLFDIANKHNKRIDYMDLVDGLDKDGYIIEVAENYVFVSPFLKSFWKRNNPIYNG